ncbi:hypothetical protein MIR68_003256 [Amoeboaphelidium protococcarum]|nr:hypothetical protein MIR68_003256 [Amoeboaphelidium protococcarum]
MPKMKQRVEISPDREASSSNQLSVNNGGEVRQRRRSPRLNRPVTPETPQHIRRDKGKAPVIHILSSSDDSDSDDESFVTAIDYLPRSFGEERRTPSPPPIGRSQQQQAQQRSGNYSFTPNPAFGSSRSFYQQPHNWQSPNMGRSGAGTAASGARAQPAGGHFPYRPFARRRRRRQPVDWTYDEYWALECGMRRYVGITDYVWSSIKADPDFSDVLRIRTPCDLKDKARNEKDKLENLYGRNSPYVGIFHYATDRRPQEAPQYPRRHG